MAINFPDSPSVNDTHTVGDKTWTWDGTVWSVVTGGVPTSISELTITNDLTVDTSTLYVDSTNNRVGIGTTSPETPLNIVTTNKLGATFTGTTDGEGLRIDQSNYTAGNYVSLVEGSYDDGATEPHVRIGAMYDGGGSNLAIGTSNSYGSGITNTAMFIDSSGNVGINDTTPSYKLDVNGDINATGDVRVAGNPVGMVLVKTQTVGSGVSSVTVSNAFSSSFQNYKIIIDGVDSTSANHTMEFNFDGATTGYYWAGWYRNFANSVGTFTGGSNISAWPIGYSSTSESTYASFEVFHPYDSTRRAHYSFMPSAGNDYVLSGGGQHASVSSFTGFRILVPSATMTGGTIRVYGYNDG